MPQRAAFAMISYINVYAFLNMLSSSQTNSRSLPDGLWEGLYYLRTVTSFINITTRASIIASTPVLVSSFLLCSPLNYGPHESSSQPYMGDAYNHGLSAELFDGENTDIHLI
jgi:hypothetical protein